MPCFDSDNVPADVLKSDFFIIGSSVYIGKLEMRKWVKKNLANIENKKIFFFVVSGTPADEQDKFEIYLKSAFSEEMIGKLEVLCLPGRLRIGGLSWFDRFLLRVGARLSKEASTKKQMLTDYDLVKRENLKELVERVKSYVSES